MFNVLDTSPWQSEIPNSDRNSLTNPEADVLRAQHRPQQTRHKNEVGLSWSSHVGGWKVRDLGQKYILLDNEDDTDQLQYSVLLLVCNFRY